MVYAVQLLPAAKRQLARMDPPLQRRIQRAVDHLGRDPRPPGVKKLSGEEGIWRIRIGDYRVLYEVRDRQQVVLVVEVGHRREVYR